MKRSELKRKTPLRSRKHEPAVSRGKHPVAYTAPTVKPLRKGTYEGTTTQAVPKPQARRNPALLEMARGRPCLLCAPGQCSCSPESVVACHSNLSVHGKAKGRKADDCYSVWGGDFAHRWLDQSGATKAVKEAAFMAAHARQVLAWREIAADTTEPARFRKAAQWALDQLNALG